MPITDKVKDPLAGQRFKKVRKHLNLSQEGMAELCEISQGLISMIERGEREIPQEVFKILFIKKKISPLHIIVGEGPVEYKGQDKGLMTNIRDLQAEMEVMKAKVKMLMNK